MINGVRSPFFTCIRCKLIGKGLALCQIDTLRVICLKANDPGNRVIYLMNFPLTSFISESIFSLWECMMVIPHVVQVLIDVIFISF